MHIYDTDAIDDLLEDLKRVTYARPERVMIPSRMPNVEPREATGPIIQAMPYPQPVPTALRVQVVRYTLCARGGSPQKIVMDCIIGLPATWTAILTEIRDLVVEFERHEALEWLQVDGKPILNQHPEEEA